MRLNFLGCSSPSFSMYLVGVVGSERLFIDYGVSFGCKIVFILQNVLVALNRAGSFFFSKCSGDPNLLGSFCI